MLSCVIITVLSVYPDATRSPFLMAATAEIQLPATGKRGGGCVGDETFDGLSNDSTTCLTQNKMYISNCIRVELLAERSSE